MWRVAVEWGEQAGETEGMERRDSPLSGPREACQGLNDITLHVILHGLGWVSDVPRDA